MTSLIKKPRPVTSNDVDMFWALLTQVFGSTMRELGPEPPPVWKDELLDLNIDQLLRGIQELKTQGENYPPSLYKFLRLCRQGADNGVRPSMTTNMPPGYERPALPPGEHKPVEECRAWLKQFCKHS